MYTGTANPRQFAHPLDFQAALHWHHLSDLFVDAVSPEPLLLRRRASTFCKAPLKKSVSSVFSASTRFRSRISLCSSRTGDLIVIPSLLLPTGPSSGRARSGPHSTPASSDMLSQLFIRSSAISRNALGYLLTRFLATCSPLSAKCRKSTCPSLGGQSTMHVHNVLNQQCASNSGEAQQTSRQPRHS
jgi:hypothetical protein